MAVRNGAGDALPTSHFFITIARGRSNRTFMARSGLMFAGLAALPVLLLWLAGSTLYLALHDDVVASLMLRQRDMQYDYEDRIAALRSKVDRDASRELLTQRSITAKLDELVAREAELQSRSSIVGRLDDQVSHALAAATGSGPRPAAQSSELAPSPSPGAALPPAGLFGSPAAPGEDRAALAPTTGRLSALSASLDTIKSAQEGQVAALDRRVQTTMTRYREALATAGLSLDRLTAAQPQASGGPFVPLTRDDDATPFARTTVGLQLSLSEVSRVARAIGHVPFNKPLQGNPDVTSPFGPRVDPFLGRPAMHTGIDFAEDSGTDVHATAPGRVTVAGPVSGYGLMVEVDHGAGLSTRYAHMSAIDVSVGQSIARGEVVGHVGATGRATGPHLHYETRIDGEAVDPARFLMAGRHLFAEARSF